VAAFKFLGRHLTQDDKDDTDIQLRMEKAYKAFGALNAKVFKPGTLSIARKVQVLDTVVNSIIMYSLDWSVNNVVTQELNVFHKKCLRTITGLLPQPAGQRANGKTITIYPKDEDVLAKANVSMLLGDKYKETQRQVMHQLHTSTVNPEVGDSFNLLVPGGYRINPVGRKALSERMREETTDETKKAKEKKKQARTTTT
jgi:hypothetical protein